MRLFILCPLRVVCQPQEEDGLSGCLPYHPKIIPSSPLIHGLIRCTHLHRIESEELKGKGGNLIGFTVVLLVIDVDVVVATVSPVDASVVS
jgi:hypothetical protein